VGPLLETVADNQAAREKAKAPVIESHQRGHPLKSRRFVEIVSSETGFYTAFKLLDPPRIVLDIRGVPGPALPRVRDVNNAGVKDILIEEGKTQMMTTRAVISHDPACALSDGAQRQCDRFDPGAGKKHFRLRQRGLRRKRPR